MPTSIYDLAEHLLGTPLYPWIEERKASGKSAETIARDLYAATEGKIDVRGFTVDRWFKDRKESVA